MWRVSLLSLAILFGVPTGSDAQEVQDTLSRISARELSDLIQALPGTGVSLQELQRTALTNNLSFESERLSLRISEGSLTQSRGTFDPYLSAFGDASSSPSLNELRSDLFRVGVSKLFRLGTQVGIDLQARRDRYLPQPGSRLSDYESGLSLGLVQPLLEGFNIADSDARIAGALRNATVHEVDRKREELIAQTELYYWDLGEAEALEAVYQKSYEVAEALLYRNRELFQRQLAPELDVLTAQSGVALRRASLIEATRNRHDAAEALLFFVYGAQAPERLGEVSTLPKTVPVPGAEPQVLEPEEALLSALSRRSDLAAVRELLRSAELAREASENKLRPDLDLEGSLSSSQRAGKWGEAFDQLGNDMAWSLGLRFSAPLGNRSDRGSHEINRSLQEQRRVSLQIQEQLIRQEIRQAIRAVTAGKERFGAAEEAARLSQQQLNGERSRLDLGLGDSFRLLEAEENAVAAELALVRARFDLARSYTYYRLALGIAGEQDPTGGDLGGSPGRQ